jgi:hypothetical protein
VGGPPNAAFGVTVTRWANGEELPTTRTFHDKAGNRIGQIEIPSVAMMHLSLSTRTVLNAAPHLTRRPSAEGYAL